MYYVCNVPLINATVNLEILYFRSQYELRKLNHEINIHVHY